MKLICFRWKACAYFAKRNDRQSKKLIAIDIGIINSERNDTVLAVMLEIETGKLSNFCSAKQD